MDFLLDGASQKFDKRASKLKENANSRKSQMIIQQNIKLEHDRKQAAFKTQKEERDTKKKIVLSAVATYESKLNYSSDPAVSFSADLTPVPITGLGDKITLPQSVLEKAFVSNEVEQPMCFRLTLPAPTFDLSNLSAGEVEIVVSEATLSCKQREEGESSSKMIVDSDEDEEEEEEEEEDEDEDEANSVNKQQLGAAIMSIVNAKRFLSTTHGGVVEFTAEEGTCGITAKTAKALLGISPATTTTSSIIDPDATPGQICTGKNVFEVPTNKIQIKMCKLPKGRECTLVPSPQAIMSGFAELADVKMVLEQSLCRLRTTISVGDEISTWHRGKEFTLSVKAVVPADFSGVCLINTDIEVNLAYEDVEPASASVSAPAAPPATTTTTTTTTTEHFPPPEYLQSELPITISTPHPTHSETPVIDILLRSPHGSAKISLPTTTTLPSLFHFVHISFLSNTANKPFQLVSRFPRRIFSPSPSSQVTLSEAGITTQEALMVEWI